MTDAVAKPESVYHHPRYYEAAFSFRDIEQEAAVIDELIRRYVGGPATRVLEIACGHGPHIAALAKRGYAYTGLDCDPGMLDYARDRALAEGVHAQFIEADLCRFALPDPVDAAFVLIGSLYVTSTAELDTHFDSMARAIRPGGIYILDRCIDFMPAVDIIETWEEDYQGIHVEVSYLSESVNRVEQTYRETLTVKAVAEGETPVTLEETMLKRAIYPQEFLSYLDRRPDFEFVGWWNDWDLSLPIDGCEEAPRAVTVIRRTT